MLKALVDSKKFNVTVIKRQSSTASFPDSVKVQTADLSSVDSVTAVFKGQDAVVSTVGMGGVLGQVTLVEAAAAAGVKRFLPSEFGSNLENPKVAALPVFGHKIETLKAIHKAVAANSDFTYTQVVNGAFLDWGLEKNLLLNWQESKPRIYDRGTNVFSATTLASVGQAVVGVLAHPDETKNRPVFVKDIDLTQNQLLALAKKVLPGKTWEEPQFLDTAEMEKSSYASLAKGEINAPVMLAFIIRVMCGPADYGAKFTKTDNELLGVKGKTEADVEALLKSLSSGSK